MSTQDELGLAPGMTITPSITLVRELGRGGMGSVWVAEHRGLKAQVVVKFIAREFALSADALGRFEREAALAAQARSPHVVQVFDHGVANNGLPYIAMELLEGEDLGTRLARERRIAPAVFADWLTQACRGLGRAHGKGIVHRDIKPENLFLCDIDGETLVKVLDFGIARADDSAGFSSTRTGAMMGTAYYMSPEQTMGLKSVDLRTDLWALGVVTYFALTGVRPFDGDAIGALVLAITMQPIAPPSRHNPTLTPAIDAWMEKALARDPAARFGSAKVMADAFSAAVSGKDAVVSDPPRSSVGGPVSLDNRTWVMPPASTAPVPSGPSAQLASSMLAASRTDPNPVPPSRSVVAPILGIVAAIAIALTAVLFYVKRGPAHATVDASAVTGLSAVTPAAIATPEDAGKIATPPPPIESTRTAATSPPTASPTQSAPRAPSNGSRARPSTPAEPATPKPAPTPSAKPAESSNHLKMNLE